ncbi:uncharacterized protein [Magallana gigas]|uniref:uncharacterized protein isoform X2 n=1 Tax=Magallana gigas TaxID=29159 RepID=UPI00333EE10F
MARWKRQGFCKQNEKYKKVTETLKCRWKRLQEPEDHSYSRTDRSQTSYEDTNEPNVDSVNHQIEVPRPAGCNVIINAENSGYDTSWREGRRVVELGVLADGLAGCKECGLPLQLSHTQGIRDCGLGSFLQVRCRNLWCGHVNVIPTGKRHGRIWDANTKLATGHCSMIGAQTGKVLGYEVRSKVCRICQSAERNKKEAKDHDCRQNWQGSSKSMEQSMVVSMVKKKMDEGVKVSTIIADDDTTTISRLRQNVNPAIQKKSDRNHIRKNFSSCLYDLKKKHKSLSTRIIQYLLKCFNYLLAQNQGNPNGIEKALDALWQHPFGNHEFCSDSWCPHINDPQQRYSSLPYGKPLNDSQLQDSLHMLCNQWKQNSYKLSRLGSTQPNESFNRSVSLKAPKNHHFSGSASLNYRVAATVAEKNSGDSYLIAVNKKNGLSPGKFTKRLCSIRESQSRKRKAIAKSKEAKRRRLELKARRSQSTASKEIQEGSTYKPGIGLAPHHSISTAEIPGPIVKPQMETVVVEDHAIVLFDLETTGLARTSHIIQLAAVHGEDKFSAYVTPKRPITPSASEITGLVVRNGKLYHLQKEVNAISLIAALDSFLKFLEKYNSGVILVGHNIKSFDCPVLFRALESCSLLSKFSSKVNGFLDTKLLFRISHPNLTSYSQQSLVARLLGCTYGAHNALEDILALQKLVDKVDLSDGKYKNATFSICYALNALLYQKEVDKNFPSLQILVEKKVLSLCMAKKIAGSALNFDSLKLAHSRDDNGIRVLFTEVCSNGSVRVTKSNKVIEAVSSFFLSLNES